MVGGDEARIPRVAAQHATDLGHRLLDHRFGRDAVVPHAVEQLRLGDHAVSVLQEVAKHLNGPRFQRQQFGTAKERIVIGSQPEVADPQVSERRASQAWLAATG